VENRKSDPRFVSHRKENLRPVAALLSEESLRTVTVLATTEASIADLVLSLLFSDFLLTGSLDLPSLEPHLLARARGTLVRGL
jgi:hypothetical protein